MRIVDPGVAEVDKDVMHAAAIDAGVENTRKRLIFIGTTAHPVRGRTLDSEAHIGNGGTEHHCVGPIANDADGLRHATLKIQRRYGLVEAIANQPGSKVVGVDDAVGDPDSAQSSVATAPQST